MFQTFLRHVDRPAVPARRLRRHRGLRDGRDLGAAVLRARPACRAHQVGGDRARGDPRPRARPPATEAEAGQPAQRAEGLHAQHRRSLQSAEGARRRGHGRPLRMAGFRGQAPLVIFLFARLVLPLVLFGVALLLSVRGHRLRPAGVAQDPDRHRRSPISASSRPISTSPTSSRSARHRSGAPGPMRSTCS